MWKKKPSNISFIDIYLKSILTINRILKEGNYLAQTDSDEQKIKVSFEEDMDTILLEIKLNEQTSEAFISTLKNNSLTKHIPILMITKSKTQFFWDKTNLSGNCFTNVNPGKNPWLMVKINSVLQ